MVAVTGMIIRFFLFDSGPRVGQLEDSIVVVAKHLK